DGRTLASGSDDGTVRLWDVTDPAHPRLLGQPLAVGYGIVDWVAFSPDGHMLAITNSPGSGSGNDSVWLWDITDPAHPRPLGQQPLTGSAGFAASVALSPDMHTMANIGGDGSVRLWDITDPAHPRPLGQPLTVGNRMVYSVVFSPDGHTLASVNSTFDAFGTVGTLR